MLGNTLALYTPAIRVAEEFAMLDCMTDGRLAAGFPVGTSMDVNLCYGVTPTETRPRFYEAHDLIMKAWTQPGPFTYNGRFNKLRYVNPWPQPLQKPHPPVWLAGGGSVETWEMAADHDYTYSYLSFFGYQFGKKLMDGFWETADRLGVDAQPVPGRLRPADLRGRDRRAGRGAVPRARHRTSSTSACTSRRTSSRRPATAPGAAPSSPSRRTAGGDRRAAALEKNWKTLVDQGFVIAGSPATVADRLIEACRACGSATWTRCCRSARCPTS